MPLTLRPTGLSSPAYRDWLDYVIVADGRAVGRIYEDRHTPPDLRWFWSITVYVDPKQGRPPAAQAECIHRFCHTAAACSTEGRRTMISEGENTAICPGPQRRSLPECRP
jgi:hypothetical protein